MQEMEPPAPPLGVLPEWPEEVCCPYHLGPGGLLAICSDGIFEAFNPERDQFEVGRVTEVLDDTRAASAGEMLAELRRRVNAWMRGREASDDQTIVLIRKA